MKKEPLYKVPRPSTGFEQTFFDGKGSKKAIRFSYWSDSALVQAGIQFSHVAAVKTRAERCCTAWHIEGAYDTLVEVVDSPWVLELREAMQPEWREKWVTKHYLIYLDSAGCFELVASGFEPIEEGPV